MVVKSSWMIDLQDRVGVWIQSLLLHNSNVLNSSLFSLQVINLVHFLHYGRVIRSFFIPQHLHMRRRFDCLCVGKLKRSGTVFNTDFFPLGRKRVKRG
ncbi:hypothetical protein CDAR_454581 [Caerostris darwini]|uniref:Uncharacterized protein n=1 Tax=Caerostris darwini TaxID=1538125 RepID=A0AAV4TXI7_9ARAC|nr:hypothetical protein CDAR_454581 [Caerostris darwini]